MKKHPVAFLIIVAAIRLGAVYLTLAAVYVGIVPIVLQMWSSPVLAGFSALAIILPAIASVCLWFLSRPIGKLILRDFDAE